MKKIGILLCSLTAIVVLCTSTAFAGPIDLNTWSQDGDPASGTWVVQSDGTAVVQTENINPTYFVSPDSYINTTFTGTFKALENGNWDDDFIGFVFGYTSTTDCFLFDWKQTTQTIGGYTAYAGFNLTRVTGDVASLDQTYWGHQDAAGFDVLDTNYGIGWADLTYYEFTLLYQTNYIKIDMAGGVFGAGTTIFEYTSPTALPEGKIGFYNYSQPYVRYMGLTTEETAPVPEPATLLLLGSGLVGLVGVSRKKKKNGI